MNHAMTPVLAEGGSLLFFLVFAIFGLIRYLMSKKENAEDTVSTPADSDEARRTREIQDEIRRRIAENMARQSQQDAPQHPVHHAPVQKSAPQTTMRQEQFARPEYQQQQAQQQSNQKAHRASDLMERLAAARHEEAESQRRIEETLRTLRARSVQTAPAVGPRQTALSVDAVSMLRSGNGIREAMILSEILSAPVAERRTPSCPGMVS